MQQRANQLTRRAAKKRKKAICADLREQTGGVFCVNTRRRRDRTAAEERCQNKHQSSKACFVRREKESGKKRSIYKRKQGNAKGVEEYTPTGCLRLRFSDLTRREADDEADDLCARAQRPADQLVIGSEDVDRTKTIMRTGPCISAVRGECRIAYLAAASGTCEWPICYCVLSSFLFSFFTVKLREK